MLFEGGEKTSLNPYSSRYHSTKRCASVEILCKCTFLSMTTTWQRLLSVSWNKLFICMLWVLEKSSKYLQHDNSITSLNISSSHLSLLQDARNWVCTVKTFFKHHSCITHSSSLQHSSTKLPKQLFFETAEPK